MQEKEFDTSPIAIYTSEDNTISLEVKMSGETVWLNRSQISLLFDRDIKTIGKHINNALKEELEGLPVVAKFATTASDGKTYQVEHYNIEMITSVGYRVKSKRGTQFRIWANRILKDYIIKGYAINDKKTNRRKATCRHKSIQTTKGTVAPLSLSYSFTW